MVNFIEPNLQEIIFGPIRVGLITQKQFWGHLKNCHSLGRTPYHQLELQTINVYMPVIDNTAYQEVLHLHLNTI